MTKVSHESVPQERSTRVSPTRVSKNVWAFVFEYVFAFGFVGSILLFCHGICQSASAAASASTRRCLARNFGYGVRSVGCVEEQVNG